MADPGPERLTEDEVGAISRAIADPRRYAILRQIAGVESLACGALEVQACLSPATISHHLKELQTAGLVDMERDGRQVRLTLRRAVWRAYLRELGSLAKDEK